MSFIFIISFNNKWSFPTDCTILQWESKYTVYDQLKKENSGRERLPEYLRGPGHCLFVFSIRYGYAPSIK